MEIKAADVKRLRDETGAGMMDAKRALGDAGGDFEAARRLLRERGAASARKLSTRSADEGVVDAYLHQPDPSMPPKVGVLVELNCATDFVAKTERFRALAREIGMHVAWARPVYGSRDEVPEDVIAREREIFAKQARDQGKPEKVIDRIVEGRMKDFFDGHVLLDQRDAREGTRTIGELLEAASAELGEPVRVRRFVRFQLGGI